MSSTEANGSKTNSMSNGALSGRKDLLLLDQTVSSKPMSDTALEAKYKQLQQESAKLSVALTQKLATSQSGQNLLHMGTSLSTLPPDLHIMLQNLHPLLSATETTEKSVTVQLEKLVSAVTVIDKQQGRGRAALIAAETYHDLIAAEQIVSSELNWRQRLTATTARTVNTSEDDRGDDVTTNEADYPDDELDRATALERVAAIAIMLKEELQAANATLTNTTIATMQQHDTEREQFIVKLASRIRRLENDAIQCLTQRLEGVLKKLPQLRQKQQQQQSTEESTSDDNQQSRMNNDNDDDTEISLAVMVLGHIVRALAIMGRSNDVETIFARIAVLPIVRSKLSMGRLDEGGSRGECAGLANLLNDMIEEISDTYSPILVAAESMFGVPISNNDSASVTMDVDLVAAGVWVPIATALMTDAGIKMSIFSPGIASILQANYTALDTFLSSLSHRLLQVHMDIGSSSTGQQSSSAARKYYQMTLSPERIQLAQDRIYAHAKTAEFSKKWNLPIYYQLRFGECCTRLNHAVDQIRREGWIANAYTGTDAQGDMLRQQVGFELSLFIELYDILLGLWQPDVILRPLTNRFLRGAIQLVGRIVAFINDGMEGRLLFGEDTPKVEDGNGVNVPESSAAQQVPSESFPVRKPYSWGESEENVAAVAWELALLESAIRHDYANVVCEALCPATSNPTNGIHLQQSDIREVIGEVLKEAGDQIYPTIEKAWNQIIVNLLTQKCSVPLAAVKGVAATYRMTNRPPPTLASPFVGTILRPLKEFDVEFTNRVPTQIGSMWKQQIVVTVADRYAAAVDDLIATVQRTEVALKNRKARRTAAGGMSDGEKVKLQLYLDCQAFSASVRDVGIEPATVIGLSKLAELTAEGEKLMKQTENGV